MMKKILLVSTITALISAVSYNVGAQQNARQNGEDATYKLNQAENEIRMLNGKIEELNFLVLQMQEQIRKMQEDNELRFQEMEGNTASVSGQVVPEEPKTPESIPVGTLVFNEQGNVENNKKVEDNIALEDPQTYIPPINKTPDSVFADAKTAFEQAEYKKSEQAFRIFLESWPQHPRNAEARFYLGESLFFQHDYSNAVQVFLDNHKEHPKAHTAPDNLLRLGLSLAGLNEREAACITYGEILKQYPDATNQIKQRIKAEQEGARCQAHVVE